MAIEKVFEIEGPPDAIWAALWADLAEGENATYSQLESSWPERLSLRVVLAAIPCRLTFTIEPGVKVLRRGETDDWPDGRNVHSLDGRFRIVGDKLSVSRCQPVRAG